MVVFWSFERFAQLKTVLQFKAVIIRYNLDVGARTHTQNKFVHVLNWWPRYEATWKHIPTLFSEVTGAVHFNWRLPSLAKMKTVMEGLQHSGEIITGKVRNLDTRCLSVVSFKLRPVKPRIRAPGGCLGPNASLPDAVQKEKFLHL
jgi:hypothetical protein